MKIITKKKELEILKRITACQIMANNYIDDVEAHTKITENLAEMSFLTGGISGIEIVRKSI